MPLFGTPTPDYNAFANQIVNKFKENEFKKFSFADYPKIKELPQWQRIELSEYIVNHKNITSDDQRNSIFLDMLTKLKSLNMIGGKSRRSKSRRSKSRRTV
jgi:hypothetical protein